MRSDLYGNGTKYNPKKVEEGRYEQWLENDILNQVRIKIEKLYNCNSLPNVAGNYI